MKVKECMCDNVCYCTPDTKISDVAMNAGTDSYIYFADKTANVFNPETGLIEERYIDNVYRFKNGAFAKLQNQLTLCC